MSSSLSQSVQDHSGVHPALLCVPEALFLRVKLSGHESNHSYRSWDEVKN